MPQYRRKLREAHAAQWTGTTDAEADSFCKQNNLPTFRTGTFEGVTGLILTRADGDLVARQNDFVVQDIDGEYYPIDPDIFNKKYEAI